MIPRALNRTKTGPPSPPETNGWVGEQHATETPSLVGAAAKHVEQNLSSGKRSGEAPGGLTIPGRYALRYSGNGTGLPKTRLTLTLLSRLGGDSTLSTTTPHGIFRHVVHKFPFVVRAPLPVEFDAFTLGFAGNSGNSATNHLTTRRRLDGRTESPALTRLPKCATLILLTKGPALLGVEAIQTAGSGRSKNLVDQIRGSVRGGPWHAVRLVLETVVNPVRHLPNAVLAR